jgi:hypothetical protein
MSSVVEIESAIEKLSPCEVAELSEWLTRHTLNLKSQRKAKMEAIRVSSGCLAGEEGADFEAAVREASIQVDAHDW